MPKRSKKVASLSGSLLVQQGSDPAVGFVLRTVDQAKKKPVGGGSGAKEGRTGGRKPKTAPERPSLRAVAREEDRPAAQSGHETVAEDAVQPASSGLTPVSNQGPGAGTVDKAAGSSLDSYGDAARGVGPRDFLAALRQGNLSKAESVFGQLTGLDPVRTKRVLYGPGGRNLVLACKALGVEQLQLVSILILTRKLGPNGSSLSPHQLTDLVSYFGDINEITAKRVLNQWRTEYIEVFGEQS